MFLTITIAISLAIDSFIVSVVCGFSERQCSKWQAIRMALMLGIFQASMLAVGWLAGKGVEKYIEAYDHWIAFILLTIVSFRFFQQAFVDNTPDNCKFHPFSWKTLIVLAVATSIDAMAVGLSVAMIDTSLWELTIATGVVTFVMSLAGVYIGRRFGMSFGKATYIVGGVVLLAIGVKILIEHM
jgi:manganese efflux pump family protein